MNVWTIAWRNLMRRKLRTFLTILSIVIGVGSTFAVIAAVDSAKTTFPLYLKAAFGKADYGLYGTEAYISDDVLHDAEHLDNATAVAVLKENTKLVLDQAGISAIQKRVDLSGYSALDTPLTGFKLVEGSLTDGGAVITDRTARVWQSKIGDMIAFDTDNGVQQIRVSAIVKYTGELMGPSSWNMAKYHPWTVAVPLPLVQDWYDLEGKIDGVQLKAAQGVDPGSLEPPLKQLVDRHEGIYLQPVVLDMDASMQTVNTFFMALYLAGFLGIALSAFIIYNSLYVSIKERRHEFAALKTIGYTPEQLRGHVLIEVMLLSIIGTLVGLLFGYGLALGLKSLIFMLFGILDEGSTVMATGFIVSVLAGLLVPLLASLYPIRQAGKVSVIGVLKEHRAPAKSSRSKWQLSLGVLLIASAFAIKHLLLLLPLMIGIALVFPTLFRLFLYVLRPVYKTISGVSGEMSVRNLERNPGRTAMTSVILCMGIAMIVLMSSLNSALITTYERIIYASYGGNLDVHLHHIEKTDLALLLETPGVADAQTYAMQSAVWVTEEQDRKLPVYGVGETWIDRFPLFTMSDRSQSHGALVASLGDDEVLLDRIAYELWGGEIGETIELETLDGVQPFTVAHIVDTMKNSGYGAFMKDDAFRDSFGLKYERNALIIKDEETSPVQLRENIFGQFGERIEEMFGPEDWVSVIGASYTGSFSIINALIVLSIIISGIGITNTLLMNIMERIRELAMMRAVGVTRRQVVRMVLLEGFGIGLAATVIGIAFGVLLIFLTSTFFEVNALTFRFAIAWNILLYIGLFGILVSLVASFTPASRAAKTPLSEALRYE